MAHKAYKFTAEVGEEGALHLKVPLPPGARVEVVVLSEDEDEFGDLRRASASTMDFWDNPSDDAAWNTPLNRAILF